MALKLAEVDAFGVNAKAVATLPAGTRIVFPGQSFWIEFDTRAMSEQEVQAAVAVLCNSPAVRTGSPRLFVEYCRAEHLDLILPLRVAVLNVVAVPAAPHGRGGLIMVHLITSMMYQGLPRRCMWAGWC